jgi:hypothetical protein
MDPTREQWRARLRKLDAALRQELRSAFDARTLLGELAEKTRTIDNRLVSH